MRADRPHPSLAGLQRILTTLERELSLLEVPWSLLELTAEDRRQWTVLLRIGQVEGVVSSCAIS